MWEPISPNSVRKAVALCSKCDLQHRDCKLNHNPRLLHDPVASITQWYNAALWGRGLLSSSALTQYSRPVPLNPHTLPLQFLLKRSFWLSRLGTGPEILHLKQVSPWCPGCWSEYTLSRKVWKKTLDSDKGDTIHFLSNKQLLLRKLSDLAKSYFCHVIKNLLVFLICNLGLKINYCSSYKKCPLFKAVLIYLWWKKQTSSLRAEEKC